MNRLALLMAVAGCILVAGCAGGSAVPRRSAGLIVGTQGSGSELVFDGVLVSGAVFGGEERSRRDAALAVREPGSVFEAQAWPAEPQPSLDNARYLYIPRQATEFLYFSGYRFRSGY